jgi:hypothetical protein
MATETEGFDFLWCWLEAAGIIAAIEVGSHLEARLGPGGAGVVENLLEESSGSPAQFREISEKRRCSMGFHLEAPVG